jgi:orotidine-5'-phosphate decarboxylase
MAGACRRAAALGAELITVHACAGSDALKAAQAGADAGAASVGIAAPTLLAVTVLTSWEEQRLQRELAIEQGIADRVSQLAHLAATAGVGGCVCSPLEVASLRAQHPKPFALVTPGIRPQGTAVGDQVRVMTPPDAIAAGASQLVIGRPISQSEDPSGAFAQCCSALTM